MRSLLHGSSVIIGFHATLALLPLNAAWADSLIRTFRSPNAQPAGRFGWCVATSDPTVQLPAVIIGAPQEDSGEAPSAGMVYAFDAGDASLLAAYAPVVPQVHGRFGFAVALPGDLDGDGQGDLVVGAPGEDGDGDAADAGRVHVLSGASGVTIRILSSPEPEPAGCFGWSVLALGDITGDGVCDLAVGAPGEMPGASRCNVGRAYLFSGADGEIIRALDAPVQVPDGRFGSSMAVLNGLAGGVIAAGVPTADDSASGAVFLFGSDGVLQRTLISPGAVPGGRFGSAVAGGGDLDNDGSPDLLVGAPGEGGGSAYVLDVENGLLLAAFHPPPSVGVAFFGRAVGWAGDVDDDGLSDAVVSYLVDGAEGWTGEVSAFGSTGERIVDLSAPEASGSSFGWSTAPLGDVDGDGRDDLAIGAYGAVGGGGEDEAGCVYLMRPSPAAGFAAPEVLRLVGPWPNPAGEHAYLFIPGIVAGGIRSVLYDAGGRHVARATVRPSSGEDGTELELSLPHTLPSGVYWWSTAAERCSAVRSLVVMR
ncbi:MAG: integrin alpha [Candidatus Eisenbacteria bacterium]|nr:integrin alpha [Candidatus Eisenbacteria bacterium]